MDNQQLAAAKTGDPDAILSLWGRVKRVCFTIASQYMSALFRAGFDRDDIEQELFVAFLKALAAYDPAKNFKFNTYLTRHVLNAVRDALCIRGGKKLSPVTVSLDEPLTLDNGDVVTRGETLFDPTAEKAFDNVEDRIENERKRKILEQCLDKLETPESDIIRKIYYDGLTVKEAGEILGLDYRTSVLLKMKSLHKLRNLRQMREFALEQSYHGTGWSAWRYGGCSVQERVVIQLEDKEKLCN